MMDVHLRRATPDDAAACGRICYEAFASIASRHHFPPDFPDANIATGLLAMLLAHPGIYAVVAEVDGQIVGSNFLDERSSIAGVGPITVSPAAQDRGIGRCLMEDVLTRADEQYFPGVRLVQAAYHNRSLSLYAKLGFAIQEPLACLHGPRIGGTIDGYRVRRAIREDLPTCNAVCTRVHGHDRGGELRDAIEQGTASLVEHDGRITGYATSLAFFGHAVGEGTEEIKALILSAPAFEGPGILVPSRNTALFRWCLGQGMEVVQVMTLMMRGLYHEPAGGYLPSVLY